MGSLISRPNRKIAATRIEDHVLVFLHFPMDHCKKFPKKKKLSNQKCMQPTEIQVTPLRDPKKMKIRPSPERSAMQRANMQSNRKEPPYMENLRRTPYLHIRFGHVNPPNAFENREIPNHHLHLSLLQIYPHTSDSRTLSPTPSRKPTDEDQVAKGSNRIRIISCPPPPRQRQATGLLNFAKRTEKTRDSRPSIPHIDCR